MRKPFIAGNWKMFKTVAEARDFAEEFKKIYVKNDVRVGNLRALHADCRDGGGFF